MEWEKIFEDYENNKGLTSKIHKQLIQLKKKSNLLKPIERVWGRKTDIFPKKNHRYQQT